jgi:uncharacterized iron-regulated protein
MRDAGHVIDAWEGGTAAWHLVSGRAWYVAFALYSMFPNASATPCNVFGNLLLAKADKVFDFVTWQVLESLQAVSIIDAFG